MKTNLIIGAGQLGSRHLQGLLKCNIPQIIYVLDPAVASLTVAQQRANEIDHTHKIHYVSDWHELPEYFNLVIVATNANMRERVTAQLLENHRVEFLVLEKVLFQELSSYRVIGDLIEQYQTKTWVNHPRRMFESYRAIKNILTPTTQKVYQVVGGDWGLGCNALHFIDLFVFLSGSSVAELEAEWLDQQISPSKRDGFIEFTGTIKGRLADGSQFFMASLNNQATRYTITLFDDQDRFIIQELETPQIYRFCQAHSFNLETLPFIWKFQSALTASLATDLFEKNTCDLPTYHEARHSHEIFIAALLDKYNQINGLSSQQLPIT